MNDEPLDKQQLILVEQNLHLVRAHLRQHRISAHSTRQDRESDDLYQEGCLGLIQAAKQYDPGSGIPFAAYALKRIHHAVSHALYEKFSTIRVPTRVQIQHRKDANPDRARPPSVHSLEGDPQSRSSKPGSDPSGGPTLGDRIREKYETAVDRARQLARKKPGRRGDRAELVDRLVENRLLVPSEEHKVALRQIARETRSSYSRVASCEKKLISQIDGTLSGDSEYQYLRQRARQSPDGLSEIAVASADSAEALLMRFDAALSSLPVADLAMYLWRVVSLTGGPPRILLARLFKRLGRSAQASLCDEAEKTASARRAGDLAGSTAGL